MSHLRLISRAAARLAASGAVVTRGLRTRTGAGALAGGLALGWCSIALAKEDVEIRATPEHKADWSRADLPVYKRAEVAAHNTEEAGIWVTYRNGVFDITEFVANHPGGNKILLAAGSAIDPFWRVYQQHLNSTLPVQLLADMQIGCLDPNEPAEEIDESDPYASDPERHPGLKFHSKKPCNAELPPELMLQDWITPKELFFIRHHHPVPVIDPNSYSLQLEGRGIKPINISLRDLQERFPKTEVVSTVQCGGNRRSSLNQIRKTSGIEWGAGAISTAKWGGVLLRDVLMYSGLLTPSSADRLGAKHVQFEGHEGLMASIPIDKALSYYGDVVLAYEMNGETLTPEHGYPVRVVVPGHVGVRNVKWVTKITVSDEEAHGPWQRGIAYKGFAPGITSFEGVDIEKVLSVQEQPVTSVIVDPQPNASIELEAPSKLMRGETQDVDVSGYAYSGGGRGIVRVDVSADEGRTWTTAELEAGSEQPPNQAWAWTFWTASVPVSLPEGAVTGDTVKLLCKATDASYNSQPESPQSIWNVRGLNNNSWHRVEIKLDLD